MAGGCCIYLPSAELFACPTSPPRAINCGAGTVILLCLHCTWQIPTSAHCKCRFVFRLSRKPGFQDPLGSHREKALGNKVLAYIESPLMKARLLFSLPQYRSFLKQQGQLNRHTLACKKREKISFPAPNKMVNLAIAKQEPGYEGDLKETPAWEENSKHGACFGRLSLLLPRPPPPDVGSAHPLPAPHRRLLGGLQHHAGGLPP